MPICGPSLNPASKYVSIYDGFWIKLKRVFTGFMGSLLGGTLGLMMNTKSNDCQGAIRDV